MTTPLTIQLHPDVPIYQSAHEAAKTLGIGENTLVEYMRRQRDPLPHIRVGRQKRLNIARAIEWLEAHQ
jgi:hypothetical protein